MRTVFIYALYRILLIAAAPLILAYVAFRGWKDRRYLASLGERLGFSNSTIPTTPGGIWLHAVSVGEVLASIQLIQRIRNDLHLPVSVSVSTLAGREIAATKLSGLADHIFYAPIDFVFVVRRVLRRLRPSVVVVMETEIWPNLYREVKRAGCGLVIVNGRISDRAFPRYRRSRWFFSAALAQPDRVLAQSERDARLYGALGVPPGRLENAGNLKYDFDPRRTSIAPEIEQFLASRTRSKIWVAASTMPPAEPGDVDEDDVVIAAFEQLEDVTLILVPRKPERFDIVAGKLDDAGIAYVRRSQLPAPPEAVLLLDSVGELSGLFALADVVFMGGTVANRGGHNVLEPAFFGVPVIAGPHMENFAEIAEQFTAARALVRITTADELPGAVRRLLVPNDIGARARAAAEARRGATSRAVAAIRSACDTSIPNYSRPSPARFTLAPLSLVWRAGASLDRSRKLRRCQRLGAPVISVGGLSMGGTGKTPLVAWLAEQLHTQGVQVAILTRGYRRKDASRLEIVERGRMASMEATGDEAQIFLRTRAAHVGIGADRYAAGRMIEDRYHPDVFLLDDGFQHAQLARDLDIVLIDALDPFAGGVFPVGLAREPFTALTRAQVVAITHAVGGCGYSGLRQLIAQHAPKAAVVTTRVVPKEWRSIGGELRVSPSAFAGKPAVAFCGVGNPAAFRQTLFDLDVDVRSWTPFPDHHRYNSSDIAQLRSAAAAVGAGLILTTEKDGMNLPPGTTFGVPAYYLRIDIQVDPESAILNPILSLAMRVKQTG